MSNGNIVVSVRFNKEAEEDQIVPITHNQKEYEELVKKKRSEHYVDRMLDVVRGEVYLSDEEKRAELALIMADLLVDLKYYDVVTTHCNILSNLDRWNEEGRHA